MFSQGQNRKFSVLSIFSQTADFVQGSGGITSGLEVSHAEPTHRPGLMEVGQPDESRSRVDAVSAIAAPHEKAKNAVSTQYGSIESNTGLLVGSSQADEEAETATTLHSGIVILGVQGAVRPLVVFKSYWADIASEELAEWYQPIILYREAA